jgi:hypothetical protein
MGPLTEKARNLIFEFEGIDQPGKFPGGKSGVTIGYGYDLGQESRGDFEKDWKPLLSAADFAALSKTLGLKGPDAKAACAALKGIKITQAMAASVFLQRSVPKYQLLTQKAFNGVDQLPADVQGMLFSIVYNRGGGMKDSDPVIRDRLEMRLIRDTVSKKDLAAIAQQIRNMRRLWVRGNEEAKWRAIIPADLPLRILKSPDDDVAEGLQRRRLAEAKVVDDANAE